ncbi:MAG: hypothetical protein JO372_02930 [Solirubrobacterales bacterium]|nr:hypothetical protein [Solirubrobacterales bacterium]
MSTRVLPITVVALLALALGACGGGGSKAARTATSDTAATIASASNPTSNVGPEGVLLEAGPILAPASTTAAGDTVDGIECAPIEQLAYHVHAHLQVYVDGQPRQLPAAIGLVDPVPQQTPDGPFYGAVRCYYWLHTHASDGIIHIESPTARIYTLGNFFDEWNQPLNADQVGWAQGRVTAYVNGKLWAKSPRGIPLRAHAVIQLDVGTPVVRPQVVSFGNQGL